MLTKIHLNHKQSIKILFRILVKMNLILFMEMALNLWSCWMASKLLNSVEINIFPCGL